VGVCVCVGGCVCVCVCVCVCERVCVWRARARARMHIFAPASSHACACTRVLLRHLLLSCERYAQHERNLLKAVLEIGQVVRIPERDGGFNTEKRC